ncbi:class I SAM-dependent methyltransferase [Streptomyces sp. PTD9-10]|uniref:class I SAM-dependent methyltransferase n=1 Tax=unclassified Streptomyces TaxID=2593676 RepID=UPI00300A48E9
MTITRQRLLEMMTAYRSTYLLRTAVELRLFDALADGPADAGEVAATLKSSPRGTRILLRSLVAAGLLDADGERFRLPDGGADLLVTSSPGYAGANVNVASSDWEWDTMKRLGDIVRTGAPLTEETADSPGCGYWVDFAENLTFVTKAGAAFVAETLGTGRADILDVGSGAGLFGYAVAGGDPLSRVWCLDWPNVLDVARKHAERLGLADRTGFIAGDAFSVPLGGPYDVVVVSNLLCQFSKERSSALLHRLSGVLRPGGRMVIAGFTTGDVPPAQAHHAHMLELLMLAWTAGGEVHSPDDYVRMLDACGLVGARVHRRDGLPLRVVVAEKPADADEEEQ